ncbi:MAG: Por secretion system protein, partial [Bacteroidales bacterium]|nr:Por secretion system protein [Bacteroidales bacterium]
MKLILRIFLLAFLIFSVGLTGLKAQNKLAFPGAEGFGRFATGGRGGSIYHVTNLNDAGAGSLRDAVSQPNRIIVFDVSGVIRLQSTLVFSKNLTVLGQTAPGEGVQVYGDRVSFSGADNIIVRYLRLRMGVDGTSGKDAAGISNGKNMIFDHLSVLWGRDENFSVSWDSKGTEPTNITIQNSIIGQGLQTHSCGGLVQTNGGVSLFRNLYIENKTRNPKVKGLNQFVNNVVYNWGNGGCYIMGDSEGPSWAHIENNYFINGPWEGATAVFTRGNANFTFYGAGNFYDGNKNGQLDGSLMTANQYSASIPVSDWSTWDNSTARPQS